MTPTMQVTVCCALNMLEHFVLPGYSFQDGLLVSGGKNSTSCTLILTEGDSAKTLAVSGLGVVGRDRYGVFPLRGKILNVREASHKQVNTIFYNFHYMTHKIFLGDFSS